MLFDMTASTNSRKTVVLNPDFPKDITVNEGTNAVFTAAIAENGRPKEYTYQWYVNGEAVPGAVNQTYTRDSSGDKGVYSVYCTVSNKAGTITSRVATMVVNKKPVLNASYPENTTVTVGNSVTAKVSISEDGYPTNYSYQWYKNGSAVSGATSSSYTFDPSVGSTSVYCIVTNAAGTVTTRTATITANPYYIYKEGDTGGWSGYGARIFDECGGNVPSISYSGKRLTINESVSGGNSRGYALKNKSDKLSKFSKMYFEIDAFYNPGYEITANIIQGHYWNDGYHYGWSTHASRSLAANGLLSLDISSLSGDYQLQILLYSAVNQGNGQISFKNIYCV